MHHTHLLHEEKLRPHNKKFLLHKEELLDHQEEIPQRKAMHMRQRLMTPRRLRRRQIQRTLRHRMTQWKTTTRRGRQKEDEGDRRAEYFPIHSQRSTPLDALDVWASPTITTRIADGGRGSVMINRPS